MTVIRVVVLDDTIGAAGPSADWSSLGPDVEIDFVAEHLLGDDLAGRLTGADVIVAMRERTPIGDALLARLPRLRLIVTTGMRNVAIDIGAAHDRGIAVCGTRGGQSSTAELAWALILGLVRDVAVNDRIVRAGGWQTRPGGDLAGRTLGLVGAGRLGARVARVARAFEMDVIAWSPHLTPERATEAGVRAVDKATLFRESDIVSIHLVLAESTRGVVGAAELGLMPSHALLVNCSRAALIDQDALRAAVEDERLAGVALDVFEQEPLPAGSWMAASDRVLLSPHLGYVTRANYRTMYADAVDDIRGWRAGAPIRMLDRPTSAV